ncbi:SH3 and cysteine-rich domain-containing protein 2-like [Schistocerca nitens]|uniref:SH3 and cysteine-rich domain-containing protein 2-like n=1 Tax=Schistocerca nitens TaxID=7011 RepID=UPI002117B4FB|nr:SH3 and cysteine-rich domain-containing protein 2-like [Schistocerca nitens]
MPRHAEGLVGARSCDSLASSCKESDAPDADSQSHTFRCKVFKRPRPCNLCHQPIHQQGSCCRVCKFVCHKACENKVSTSLLTTSAIKDR